MNKLLAFMIILFVFTSFFMGCQTKEAQLLDDMDEQTIDQIQTPFELYEETAADTITAQALPDGYISEILSPINGETEGIISTKDGCQSIDIFGVWCVDIQETAGANDTKDNIMIPYCMMSIFLPPALCFNSDGTGYEDYRQNRDAFTWEYIIEDSKRIGVVYKYHNSVNGWLLYLDQADGTIVFSKVALDGSDTQYGEGFNRTIQLTKRSPYILIHTKGGTHAPYSIFTHGNTKTKEGVLHACGEPINPDDIKVLHIVKASEDIETEYYGQLLSEPSFSIYRYDDCFDLTKKDDYTVTNNHPTLELPAENGIYLVQVSIVWGVTQENWSAHEYYFKLEIS